MRGMSLLASLRKSEEERCRRLGAGPANPITQDPMVTTRFQGTAQQLPHAPSRLGVEITALMYLDRQFPPGAVPTVNAVCAKAQGQQ